MDTPLILHYPLTLEPIQNKEKHGNGYQDLYHLLLIPDRFLKRISDEILHYNCKNTSVALPLFFSDSAVRSNYNTGLPQGVVLSTTLFALYISDMPHPPNTQLALYADDTAILAHSCGTDTIIY